MKQTLGGCPSRLAEELRERRKQLGLDATAPALFLCDDADQHRNPTYRSLRALWCKENNAIILGSVKGDDDLPDVPGIRAALNLEQLHGQRIHGTRLQGGHEYGHPLLMGDHTYMHT